MKRILCFLMACTMCASAAVGLSGCGCDDNTSSSSSSKPGYKVEPTEPDLTDGDFGFFIINQEELMITKYTGSDTVIEIPESYKNYKVTVIGSGGLLGKGFLNGTQTKLKYVPEQDTDFIFCTVGEEEGFLGSAIVLLLFMTLILRLIVIAERQHTRFGRVYGYSVLSIFLFHLFINIGMVLGLTPVIGIPLPFFSYGGSSLWGFTILLFVFLRIDSARGSH